MKIVSWNVNGLRSVLGKGFADYLAGYAPDVLCLQEIKARPEQIPDAFPGYRCFWNPAERPGYSGTAILSRVPPLKVIRGLGEAACDAEGRVLALEFPDWHVVCAYAPNVGPELARLEFRTAVWAPAFLRFLRRLDRRKPVVFCGDMNVAVEEIDLARPRENRGRAGFTDEERADFRALLAAGFVDAFRHFEPRGGHYTWWSYRAGARKRNVGWRIDYACVSKRLLPSVSEAFIQPEVGGSDHCPTGLRIG